MSEYGRFEIRGLRKLYCATRLRGGKGTRFVGEHKRPENRVTRFPLGKGGTQYQRGDLRLRRSLQTIRQSDYQTEVQQDSLSNLAADRLYSK